MTTQACRCWLVGAIVFVLAACGDGKPPAVAANGGKSPATPVADAAIVKVDPELAKAIRIGAPENVRIADTLRIAGRLEVNGARTARIGAPVTGRISDIRAFTGKDVRQGETLALLNSQEATQAQLAFLKAHSTEQLTARAVDRAQLLLAADVIGSAELQRRQSELSVARAEKRAATDQLGILGISRQAIGQLEADGKLNPAAPITATQAGTVIEHKIAVGQVVQPSDSLFVVSDLRSVWAIAEVPEQQAEAVRRGQRVEIEIPAIGNERRTGEIVFVADVVNPETRTVRVGVVLDNPGRVLKPAMLMTMFIEWSAARRPVVPGGAVVREADADHLFLVTAPGVARLTRVKLGAEKSGMRALLEDLPANQGVVLEGAFHLNSERQKRNTEKGG